MPEAELHFIFTFAAKDRIHRLADALSVVRMKEALPRTDVKFNLIFYIA
jgi:hypothetical protein